MDEQTSTNKEINITVVFADPLEGQEFHDHILTVKTVTIEHLTRILKYQVSQGRLIGGTLAISKPKKHEEAFPHI